VKKGPYGLYTRARLMIIVFMVVLAFGVLPITVHLIEAVLASPIVTNALPGIQEATFFGIPLAYLASSIALFIVIGLAAAKAVLEPLKGIRYQDLSDFMDNHAVPEELQELRRSVIAYESRTRELRDSRGRIFRHLSHQIKTPLTVLRLRAKGTDLERDVTDTVKSIAAMLDQMMALARMDSMNSPELRKQMVRVNLAEVVWSVTASRHALIAEKDLDIEIESPSRSGDSDVTVPGIPLLIHDALANLFDNAVRYSPPGGTIRIRVGTEDETGPTPGRRVYVELEDDGPGVPEAERDLVFEPFYGTVGLDDAGRPVRGRFMHGSQGARAEGGEEGREGGEGENARPSVDASVLQSHGLGLAIVKASADFHQGSVRFLGPEGQGARIRIALPAA
jgi:two-component system sensor histidine kinase TctE